MGQVAESFGQAGHCHLSAEVTFLPVWTDGSLVSSQLTQTHELAASLPSLLSQEASLRGLYHAIE